MAMEDGENFPRDFDTEYFSLSSLVSSVGKAIKSVGSSISSGLKSVASFIKDTPLVGALVSAIPGVGPLVGAALTAGSQFLPGDQPSMPTTPAKGALDGYNLQQIALGLQINARPTTWTFPDAWSYYIFPPFENMAIGNTPPGLGSKADPRLHYAEKTYAGFSPNNVFLVWDYNTHNWREFRGQHASEDYWPAADFFNQEQAAIKAGLQNGTLSYNSEGNLVKAGVPPFVPGVPTEQTMPPPQTNVQKALIPASSNESGFYTWTHEQAVQVAQAAYNVFKAAGAAQGIYYIFENFAPANAVMQALRALGPLHFDRTAGVHYDACLPCSEPQFFGVLPPGEFYRGSNVTARLSPILGDGIYGEVVLNDLPFPVTISSKYGPGRARIALAHELAHVANKLYKFGLNHEQVHDLGVYYATEGIPAMEALQKHLTQR
jgi:hypothetical protein